MCLKFILGLYYCFLAAQKLADENTNNTWEPNTVILDKLRSEMNNLVKCGGVRPADLDFKSRAVSDEAAQRVASLDYDSKRPEFNAIPALD